MAYHAGMLNMSNFCFDSWNFKFNLGLKDKERFGIQDDWQQEKCKIIVATVSFGMGVDKSNVR